MDYFILLCLKNSSITKQVRIKLSAVLSQFKPRICCLKPPLTPAMHQLATSRKLIAVIDNDYSLAMLADLSIPIPVLGIRNPELSQKNFGKLPYLCESISALDASYLDLVYCRFYHLPYTIGQTKRTCLRELSQTDLPYLYQIYQTIGSHPLSVTLPDPDPIVEAEKLSAYQHTMYELYGFGLWGVFLQENGQLIGHCGIELQEETSHTIGELSYLIAPAYQHQGYAYEVCQEILRLAYEELGFTKIRVRISCENLISLKLASKLGFQHPPFCRTANSGSICYLYHHNTMPIS